MNITLPSLRLVDFLAFLLCIALLAFCLYLEIALGLEPCPLCVLQRMLFIALGVLFLVGACIRWGRNGQVIYHSIIVLVALLGFILAARQVWIQHLPPWKVPSCGANFNYLFQVLPFHKALMVVFQGTGSCAKVTWSFLGCSIPGWSLTFFAIFILIGIWQVLRKR